VYIDPAEADRLVNWFSPKTTNRSITVPKRYASQVPWPAFENARGMIRTAVIVGDMSAIDWASRAGNPRAFERSPADSAELVREVFVGALVMGAAPSSCVYRRPR
jgi:hypothetical protein